MYDIVILTESRYENPKKIDWYIQQVLTEDTLLQKALEKNNLKVIRKDWLCKKFDWSATRYVIFRTTWDYFDKINTFIKWIEKVDTKTKFINYKDLIIWNIDKHYLKDLKKKNINIPPTHFIKKGEYTSLIELFDKYNWKEAIIKPAISGAARETYRINRKNLHKYELLFKNLINKESMLFQKFLENIINIGEISLIIIGGRFTHAVRKIAKEGDFRVQDDHGGTVEPYIARNEEIDFAENVVKQCNKEPIYARVDIIYDDNNEPSLSELELIEPELWFRNYPTAAKLLANEIAKKFI